MTASGRAIQVRIVPLTVDGKMKIVIEATDGANAEIFMSLASWSKMTAKPGTNVDAEWHQEAEE
jgi:hypothetical protein